MGIAIHRTTKRVHTGVDVTDTTRFPTGTWFTLSRPLGDEAAITQIKALWADSVPPRYWNLDDGPPKAVTEMSASEKAAVDAAVQAQQEARLATIEKQALLEPAANLGNTQTFLDDFMYGVRSWWTPTADPGGSIGIVAPGVLRLSANASAGDEARLLSNGLKVGTAGFQELRFRVREETEGNQTVIVGLYQDDNNFLVFRRQNNDNWLAQARKDGNAPNTIDTGVPAAPSNGYRVYRFDRVGSDAVFKIDGQAVATMPATNAPAAATLEFLVLVQANSGVAAPRSLDVDAVRLRVDRP